ncbi:MAG: alpha/beta hydrolase [Hyphomicrobiaceae bacterium]
MLSFFNQLTLDGPSLLAAAILCGVSLTPSLMPRDPIKQGLLAGLAAAMGYVGVTLATWLLIYLQVPPLPAFWSSALDIPFYLTSAAIVIVSLAMAPRWQNMTRSVMGLPPVAKSHRVTIAVVALSVFLVMWLAGHLFGFALQKVSGFLEVLLPPRVSLVIGLVIVAWLFWAAIDGALVRRVYRAMDRSFEAADIFIEPDLPAPEDPLKSGSSKSLIPWDTMGRWGRSFVSRAPTANEISEFFSGEVKEPIRVYVGRRSAQTARERAELALNELIRVGGFDRAALVVAVPVGTGWMDPGGHDTLDFMLGGDVATVSVQYSYLTSGLALLAHPQYGTDQAQELFDVVYGHWKNLPKDRRSKFYISGLSQGAYNSQATLPLLDLLADPIQGALWVGSPFFSSYWSRVRDQRVVDSPAWQPRFGNSSLARVANQNGAGLSVPGARWGPIRLIFLNYGSDPIVAFTFDCAFRRPDWLRAPRAPDVPSDLRWFPIVTMLQIALDTALSLDVPRYGHYYTSPDYIDAWAEVVDPPNWDASKASELKRIFSERGPAF